MAHPPGDETRSYSPSKLTALPPTYLTPSNNSLNNSGAYMPAALGPITASGHGQPRHREDGQAYWDDSKPTITIPSSSPPPAAGRSPLDSAMNSPESEEPTLPAIRTTQVGPATLQAMDIALDTISERATNTQDLWDNMPSLPAALPPLPEEIAVRGRSPTASHTPRGRSRAPSNASVWSHATVESASANDSPERSLPISQTNVLHGVGFTTIMQAVKAGLLPDPYDPAALDTAPMTFWTEDSEYYDHRKESTDDTLRDELTREVTEHMVGWGAYRITKPLELRKDHGFPIDSSGAHSAAALVLTMLDAGAALHDGELAITGLSPSSMLGMARSGAVRFGDHFFRTPNRTQVRFGLSGRTLNLPEVRCGPGPVQGSDVAEPEPEPRTLTKSKNYSLNYSKNITGVLQLFYPHAYPRKTHGQRM